MLLVLPMLVPAAIAHVLAFGPGLLLQACIATAAALLAESVMLRLRGQPQMPFLTDGSAVVTAVLLAFALPPLAPWWLACEWRRLRDRLRQAPVRRAREQPVQSGDGRLRTAAGLISGRHDPLARPAGNQPGGRQPHGVRDTDDDPVRHATRSHSVGCDQAATPLDAVRTGLTAGYTMQEILSGVIFGSLGGRGWDWVSLAALAGGIGLLAFRVIRWHIPVAMLLAVTLFAGLLNALDPGYYPGVLFHLTTGATLLGAFFIACDPVTAATSDRGRLWFGAGVGILVIAIRSWGQYPDGVAFAVLIMNLFVPLIDRFTVPRVYGHAR